MPSAVLLTQLARGRDMWATQDPSGLGLAVGAVLALVACGLAYLALRRDAEPRAATPASGLSAELDGVRRARQRLQEALAGTSPGMRAALTPLLAGPLHEVDQRVVSLVQAAGRAVPVESPAEAAERERLRAQHESETDPRARALLAATLSDLEAARRVRQGLAMEARLARLELRRLQGLLEALPARLQALSSQQGHGSAGVEAIARQLEQAVASTREVLEPAPSEA
jgi:hypothetical protein